MKLRWILLAGLLAQPAFAKVLRVGEAAPTLQATLDLAQPGDVVELPEGTWKPAQIKTPKITLRGRGGVIDGKGEGTCLRISAADVVIDRVHIKSSGEDLSAPDACVYIEKEGTAAIVQDSELRDCGFGIWVHETHHVQLLRNIIVGKPELRVTDRGNGIQLFDGKHIKVVGNEVQGARDGIYISATEESLIQDNITERQRFGIHYMFSYNNTLRGNISRHNRHGFALMESKELIVEDNLAEGNEEHGILFRDAERCVIQNNRMIDNGEGFFFFSSIDNKIIGNAIIRNKVGAKIWAGSKNNLVQDNVFIGNKLQIFYTSTEAMDWGKDGPGNYWSDYFGWDQDGDGIGDRPYRVDGFTSNLTYRYPAATLLMRSPALEMLSHLQRRLPVFQVPTVTDHSPLTQMHRMKRSLQRRLKRRLDRDAKKKLEKGPE